MKRYLIMLLLLVNFSNTRAQNNAIFNGGTSDGWDKKAFLQAGNNIFKGGDGDGWTFQSFSQAGNSIYNGGDGDGWSFSNYVQTANNIYVGGIADGWASGSFLQAGNAIYTGGVGDGWSNLNFLQADNNIFVGGTGDGWATTYRALGPLPVTFIIFTAAKNGTASLLKWQTAKEENSSSFDVERSADAVSFIKIGSINASGNSSSVTAYNFTDRQPLKGYNYYRLKQLDRNGLFFYTPTRAVLFDGAALELINAYPVPTTHLLTVDLPSQLRSKDVVLNVSNAIGVMVQQVKLSRDRADDRRVLNLGSLPPGVYTLQVASQNFNGVVTIIKQ